MSEFKVFADKIELFPHPSADKLSLGRIGTFQIVIAKDLYKAGDLVVFAPKRSILPIDLRSEFSNPDTGHSYLKGVNSDRVGSIRLRGEESEGVTIDSRWVISKLGIDPVTGLEMLIGQDLSEKLGITEYIPGQSGTPGQKKGVGDYSSIQKAKDVIKMDRWVRHDVEQYGIFKNEFIPGELVNVTEKLHGSSVNVSKDKYGNIAVSSKGRAEKNFVLREYPKLKIWRGNTLKEKLVNAFKTLVLRQKGPRNEYWKVADSSGILDFLKHPRFQNQEVQVIGEGVPWQSGYLYGLTQRSVLVFRLIVGTIEQPYGEFPEELQWVPLLYSGPYDPEKILPLAEGKETVSGGSLHLREGIVLTPAVARKTVKGVPLIVKIIGSKFKSSDEDPT